MTWRKISLKYLLIGGVNVCPPHVQTVSTSLLSKLVNGCRRNFFFLSNCIIKMIILFSKHIQKSWNCAINCEKFPLVSWPFNLINFRINLKKEGEKGETEWTIEKGSKIDQYLKMEHSNDHFNVSKWLLRTRASQILALILHRTFKHNYLNCRSSIFCSF